MEAKEPKSFSIPITESNYVTETLKLIESTEIREHMTKWIAEAKLRRPVDACARIIYHAPISIVVKLTMLKGLFELYSYPPKTVTQSIIKTLKLSNDFLQLAF